MCIAMKLFGKSTFREQQQPDMQPPAGRRLHLLFLAPLTYRPDLPNFRDRYAALSERYDVDVIAPCENTYNGIKMGEATLYTIPPYVDRQGLGAMRMIFCTVLIARHLSKKQKIDAIIAYDPLTLGVAAVILRMITGTEVFIEINGHLLTAAFVAENTPAKWIKRFLYRTVIGFCIRRASAIKLLNNSQRAEFYTLIGSKPVFVFPEYVPTHIFSRSFQNKGYLFFAGFPFYLKGVDILIQAFKKISPDYPDTRLIIMGYHSEAEAIQFSSLIGACKQIEIKRPVNFDEILDYFRDCLFFVLPSRSEAMGRVLIEAMACGKPVVGSAVGGIPDIIQDGKNGLLFRSEDADDLAEKLAGLLGDPVRLAAMGEYAYEDAHGRLSSVRYLHAFHAMVTVMMQKRGKENV